MHENATLMPRRISARYKRIMTVTPAKPSSSAVIAKTKSLYASGRYEYFWMLFPKPAPVRPPEPIAHSEFLICASCVSDRVSSAGRFIAVFPKNVAL